MLDQCNNFSLWYRKIYLIDHVRHAVCITHNNYHEDLEKNIFTTFNYTGATAWSTWPWSLFATVAINKLHQCVVFNLCPHCRSDYVCDSLQHGSCRLSSHQIWCPGKNTIVLSLLHTQQKHAVNTWACCAAFFQWIAVIYLFIYFLSLGFLSYRSE